VCRFLCRRRSRYALAWLVALALTAWLGHEAWNAFRDPGRADGTEGHVTIDFGGQWLMGRMLVEGQGRHLFGRNYQRALLERNLPVSDQNPGQEKSDVARLMGAFMGEDSLAAAQTVASFLVPLAAPDAPSALALLAAGQNYGTADRVAEITAKRVSGPLYPPVHALFFAPLAVLEPYASYRLVQALNFLLTFACGLAVSRLSGGRVWWPIATILILGFPGSTGSCRLGQNATLSLALLLWGWVLMAAGRPGWGGVLWGLLAYKPVWAMPFFLALGLTRRWRAALAMLGTGAALGLATLPFVGLESWFDWLEVGKIGVHVYNYDENWIFLSRDLLSIPRRWLLDFQESADVRAANVVAPILGWVLLGTVAGLTAALALWRRRQAQAVSGPIAACVLLAAWLCCFHFMYYDALLAAFPMLLLTTAVPRDYLRVRLTALPGRVRGSGRESTAEDGGSPGFTFCVSNVMIGVLLIGVLIAFQLWVAVWKIGSLRDPPLDTLFLLLVWSGCGWVWLRTPVSAEEAVSVHEGAAESASVPALQPSL
jgi:hypothetical protein